jgi:hypothetical protein
MKRAAVVILLSLAALCARAQTTETCLGTNTAVGSFTVVNCQLIYGGVASVTWTHSVTAGHQFALLTYLCENSPCLGGSGGIAVISDNLNNPETCFSDSPNSPFTLSSGGAVVRYTLAVCPSMPSGVTSVTVSYNMTFGNAAWFIDLTGGLTSGNINDLDGCAVSASAGTSGSVATQGTGCPTTSAATANANDLVLGFIDVDIAASETTGSGYTKLVCDAAGNGCLQAKNATSTGAQTVTATWSSSGTWEGVLMTVKGPVAASGVHGPWIILPGI